MSDILISGSTGFIGNNLKKCLSQAGNEIFELSRKKECDKRLVSWQLEKDPKTYNFNVFIHLAGKAHDTKNTSTANEYFEVNTNLTKKLFDLFLQSPANVFIFMSSVKAAADTVADVLIEEVLPNPKTPYGQSKHLAEDYILKSVLPAGKRVFILRPCMIHGPGNKGNLNDLYKFVKKRIPYPLGVFNNSRSFLSISNLNFIIEKLISEPNIRSGIYNIADDEPLSTNEVISIVAKTIGLKPKLWKVNKKLIESFAFVGDKLKLPFNTEILNKLTENYVVSNDKIKRALNINYLPTSSYDGLVTTIKSISEQ